MRLCVSFYSLFRQPSPTLKPFPSQSRDRSETETEMEEWREDEYGMAESQIGPMAARRERAADESTSEAPVGGNIKSGINDVRENVGRKTK